MSIKTTKTNIYKILNVKYLDIFEDLVIRTNKIVVHTYNFLKLRLLYLFENNINLPKITEKYIKYIFQTVSKTKINRNKKTDVCFDNLQIFYKNHYLQTLKSKDIVYRDHLTEVLAYEAKDMITNIKNNIILHFLKHLNKYINCKFNYIQKKKEITKKPKSERSELYKKLNNEFGKIKDDVKCFDQKLNSDEKYHKWILKERSKLFPDKNKFTKNNILYDIKSNPLFYLYPMIRICKKLEKWNLKDKNNKIKLFNILPLRTSIIPKNIVIDTLTAYTVLIKKKKSKYKNFGKDNLYDEIWSHFFDINKRIFKKGKGYKFNHMITTDGVSINILFEKDVKKSEHKSKNIENIGNLKTLLNNKKIVVCDPGKESLGYFASWDKDDDLEIMKYTQAQRRFEIKTKRYRDIIYKLNQTVIKNSNKTVEELQTVLSNYNSKTADFITFKNYCIAKNQLNKQLIDHYEQYIFRKLKLNRYTNTQKSENKMVNKFSEKFGKPNNTVLIMGNWSNETSIKGTDPTICKKFRKIFSNNGYKVYLIDEYKTSKLCNGCYDDTEKFLYTEHKNGNHYLCHKLLRCKSKDCGIIHNRDKNAVQNMLYIVEDLLKNGNRPKVFKRKANNTHESK